MCVHTGVLCNGFLSIIIIERSIGKILSTCVNLNEASISEASTRARESCNREL